MGHEQGTAIEPGIIARVLSGVRYAVTGKQDFFGPSQPMAPAAQDSRGRAFDYASGQNIQISPRASEPITFQALRELADGYDLLRLVIETRKDQISRMKWTIKPFDKDQPVDDHCKELIAFMRSPNREDDWSTWLRQFVEDILVLDGAVIVPQFKKGGALYSLDLVDPSTIKRVINVDGRTPMPPDVAYQQVLKGIPASDFHSDELIYCIRNKRTHKIYGYSPVEQIMMTVNIALRRQLHQLQYYTEGNIPEALIGVPPDWTPDQIAEFQEYWDQILTGNTAARRHAKFVPGGMTVLQTKEEAHKDAFEEWLARVVCFAFSISPSAFTKDVNRATAQTQQSAAKEEGLEPLMGFTAAQMNRVLRLVGRPDLEFCWIEEVDENPLTAATIDQIYITAGVVTRNEVRVRLGMDPIDDEAMDRAGPPPAAPMFGGGGFEDGKEGDEASVADQDDGGDVEPDKKVGDKSTKLFDIHVHMPEQVVKFEPVIDVQSPIVHAHINLEAGEAVAKLSKKG